MTHSENGNMHVYTYRHSLRLTSTHTVMYMGEKNSPYTDTHTNTHLTAVAQSTPIERERLFIRVGERDSQREMQYACINIHKGATHTHTHTHTHTMSLQLQHGQ